jgi:UPF0176 protein
MFLSGTREHIDRYLDWVRSDPRLADLEWKESLSAEQSHRRMLVRIKKEIITMRMPLVKPEDGRAPAVDAATLKRWLDQGHDDTGKPVVMVDTRNAFEVDVGTFTNTRRLPHQDKFTEFPEVIAAHKDDFAGKTVVTFCTGGIRCEKAAIHMQNIGYENVYQLEGGILKYFEEVGGAHYTGDCFVFDYRTALNPKLEPTETVQCFACRAVVTPRQQLAPEYVVGVSCPHCTAGLDQDSLDSCNVIIIRFCGCATRAAWHGRRRQLLSPLTCVQRRNTSGPSPLPNPFHDENSAFPIRRRPCRVHENRD